MSIRNLTVIAAALGLAVGLLGAGCYAEAGYPGVSVGVGASADVVGNYGYEPQYYDGYMVYYDTWGRPFYYANGAQIFISTASPYYPRYVQYYRLHGSEYNRWYAGHGYRYRGYRMQGGYYGGHYGSRYSGPAYRGGERRTHEMREHERR